MTQKSLGERIGASANTIHLWETRVTKPNVAYLIRLAEVMDKPLEELIEKSLTLWDEDSYKESSLFGGKNE
jgi:transcriptional regulator with XRE-family HTH domain